MKAILIDVLNENVRMVEIDDKNVLNDWYKKIGCSMVEVAHYFKNDHDSIMVDEEGFFSIDKDSKFFSVKGGHQPFIGNGLVVGVDNRGNSVDPIISVEEVRSMVEFYTLDEVRVHEFGVRF
jgi:hypothetical protein